MVIEQTSLTGIAWSLGYMRFGQPEDTGSATQKLSIRSLERVQVYPAVDSVEKYQVWALVTVVISDTDELEIGVQGIKTCDFEDRTLFQV